MDAENQIDNNSLMDSLLDGNDDSAIGGDAVPSSTSDGVNKSSKRMQYFGAVFNLANTVRKFFFFSFFVTIFLTYANDVRIETGVGRGYSCDALCIRTIWTCYGSVDYCGSGNTLCAFTRDCHIGYVLFISLSSLHTHEHTHTQLQQACTSVKRKSQEVRNVWIRMTSWYDPCSVRSGERRWRFLSHSISSVRASRTCSCFRISFNHF